MGALRVLLRRGEGGDSAAFACAFEKRASADAWLLAPSQLEWRRLNSGSTSWAIKQQRFAPRCFRPAASYNDSCGRCCTLPATRRGARLQRARLRARAGGRGGGARVDTRRQREGLGTMRHEQAQSGRRDAAARGAASGHGRGGVHQLPSSWSGLQS